MEYELIREIINPCAGDKRPEVSLEEIETDDADAFVRELWGPGAGFKKSVSESGSLVYEQNIDGMIHRLTFTA
jgi:hypothetical protein